MSYLEGTLKVSTKGVGYVSPDSATGPEDSIEIGPTFLNTGLPGDRVRVLVHAGAPGPDKLKTGEVVEILGRRRTEFVGVLEQDRDFFFVVPDDKRIYKDILVPATELNLAKAGDKVLVSLQTWTDPKKDPIGAVVEVIGRPGDHETEMRAIVLERGFKTGFPGEVEEEAKSLKGGAKSDLDNELKCRRDFRSVLTLTIDPLDAKDFDDAISFKEVGGGRVEVGVHIADVSHYVQPGTALDREAAKRATSIYLVDRTIPMLPEILSNDLCSLNEREDKLAFSAVFTFDADFKIVEEWFGRTVIHSAKRLTYEAAQDLLEAKTSDVKEAQTSDVKRALDKLNEIAKALRRAKMAAGAIAFETTEIKFKLDEHGKPLAVVKKERKDAHLLVEDFMLLANRRVAEFVSKFVHNAAHKFVYRVHDLPDTDKLKQLATFIEPLGYKLKFDEQGVSSQSINELLQAVAGRPEETMIQTAAMRSMAKAVYGMKNIGHYGLAFPHYTHFTSPIRRYPDLMVHRLLAIYLEHQTPPSEMLKKYDELANHASQMELNAQEAERDSIRYKQIEFLTPQIGQTFKATISGLAKWGIYVQEESTLADGLVRLMDLSDDYYIFDEKNYAMVGKNTGRRFRLGDQVKVKLTRTDLPNRQLDFIFA